ncbi:MAG: hypothetical protein AB7W59_00030 [Acidimicrobiia bacterium]
MKPWLICFAVLACSLPASAQCVVEAEATPASTCVVMPRAGVRGVWFILEEADRLRRAHLEVPELRLQVERLESLADIEASRAGQYREAAELRLENTRALEGQLEEALRREAAARAEAGAWYREPALWFTLGAVVATAVLVAIIASD